MDPDLPPAGWTDEALQIHRIGIEPHSIAVGTARDETVESLIRACTQRQPVGVDAVQARFAALWRSSERSVKCHGDALSNCIDEAEATCPATTSVAAADPPAADAQLLYVSPVSTSKKDDPTRLDYLIAGRIGTSRVLRPAMNFWGESEADESEACMLIGRGQPVDGEVIHRAYDFYRAVWTSVSTTALVPFLGTGIAIKAINGTRHAGTTLVVLACVLLAPWVALVFTSMVLSLLGSYRIRSAPARTGKALKQLSTRPPELSDDGEDFWYALASGLFVAALVVGAIILG